MPRPTNWRPAGRPVKGFQADVTDYAAVQRAVEAIRGGLGPIEHVFFAVGIGSGKFGFPFWNLEPADWPRVINVNLIGAANVAHAVGAGAGGRAARGRCCSSRRSPVRSARRPIRPTAPPRPG